MQSHREQTTSIQSKVIAALEASPDTVFRRDWEKWEEDIVKKYYGRKRTVLIAKLLNRSTKAVGLKAFELGVKK